MREVLFVGNNPELIGGGEMVVKALSRQLQQDNCRITYYTSGHLPATSTLNDIKTIPSLSRLPGLRKFPSPAGVLSLLNGIKEKHPTHVILSIINPWSLILAWSILSREHSTNLVTLTQGDPLPNAAHVEQVQGKKEFLRRLMRPMPRWLVRTLLPLVMNRASINLAVSSNVAKRLKELGVTKPISVCNPPVTHENVSCKPTTRELFGPILTVTRIALGKNLRLMVEVARLIPGLRFEHVGPVNDPEYAAELRAMKPDNLTFVGPQSHDQLCASYTTASILFHPAQNEGYGLVTAEGLIHGTPVTISVDSPLAEDVVRVEAGSTFVTNRPEEVATAVQKLCDNPNAWKRASKAALSLGQQFSEEIASQKMLHEMGF